MRAEEALQRQILAELVPALMPRGILVASIGAEIAIGGGMGKMLQAAKKAMGGVPGMTDLIVIYPGGRALLMEVKKASQQRLQPVDGQLRVRSVGAGQLSAEQRAVRDWASRRAVPWALVRSVEEARAAVATYDDGAG